MLKFIEKLFGSKRSKDVQHLLPLVEEINEIYATLESLSDEELKAKTTAFRALINERAAEVRADIETLREKIRTEDLSHDDKLDTYDELARLEDEEYESVQDTLEEILPEAFAVVKETCRRMVGHVYSAADTKVEWKEVPYDVQLMGAIVLHQGKIAEMATGEGKTLTSVMPLYLNALPAKGVHLVTVNDYLARRDAEWMQPVFDFHGITIGCVQSNMPQDKRKAQYECDITYGTNSEFGFDYLRDNMVGNRESMVQREHYYCIVDEIDSALIDEARTPLIISGPVQQQTGHQYEKLNPAVRRLVEMQKRQVAHYVVEAERLYNEAVKKGSEDKPDKELLAEAGVNILRAYRGFPKNKRYMKLVQEPQFIKLRTETELEYLRDQGRRMAEIDEDLYYSIEEKQHQIDLTEKGREFLSGAHEDADMFLMIDMATEMSAIEGDQESSEEDKQLKKDELMRQYSERSERIHVTSQLLRAYSLYENDIEYVVQNNKVQIVDENTGRILDGRRYSDGLHQAIEAKEGVKIEKDTQTFATVTLQNYFRLYRKMAGMTGTAETESAEFFEIYKLDVVVVPTNRPIARDDMNDQIYRTKREKYNAVVDEIKRLNDEGRPVLVGTVAVEESEKLSKLLKRAGVKHNVLNAKQHQREAEIVAEAGRRSAVTIATNMAGRGTDIKLTPETKELGGLAIVGTERHDSRRIDRQLRGRSGRQGDPGSSRFYLSLEDKLMRLFGGERVGNMMQRLKVPEGEPIEHKMMTNAVERAQKKVEENNFSVRKRLLEYDDVMNSQRTVIYDRRRHVLQGERMRGELFEYIEEMAGEWYDKFQPEADIDEFRDMLRTTLLIDLDLDAKQFGEMGQEQCIKMVVEAAEKYYKRKEEMLGPDFMLQLERVAFLQTIDEKWRDHLRAMDDLKEGIGLRGYAQKNPIVEYKAEAFGLFQDLIRDINRDTVNFAFKFFPRVVDRRTRVRENDPRVADAVAAAASKSGAGAAAPAPAGDAPRVSSVSMSSMNFSRPTTSMPIGDGEAQQEQTSANGQSAKRRPVTRETPRIGRNDPCPCGSGKKYKACHGRS